MKQLIKASEIVPNNPIKAQFCFSDNNYVYWGIVTPTSLWYKYETIDSRNNYDFTLLPIPLNWATADEYEYLVFDKDEDAPCYPFDEYKFSKINKSQLLKRIHQESVINYNKNCNINGTIRQTINRPYLLIAGNDYYACKDDEILKVTTTNRNLVDWYLIGMESCDVLMDINLTGAYQIIFDINEEQSIPLYCCIRYKDYHVILSVATAKNCINKKYQNLNIKITADNNGKLGKETFMNFMDKLGKLSQITEEKVDETEFIEALKQSETKEPIKLKTTVINIAPEEVEKPTTITIENMKESNKVIPMEESERVIPMTVPQENVTKQTEIPSKNVTEPTEIPQENVEKVTEIPHENVSENTKDVEEQPLTIDSLRYEFTELKTKVTLFDKHLREFAKNGACSKKSQTELEKYKTENMKLREEVKRLSKAAEQFEKVQKYLADLSK